MKIRTHAAIDPRWVGKVTRAGEGRAEAELETRAEMAADAEGLVHGGFIFGLADYAAMIAVNEPTVVLAKSTMKFLKPVRAGQKLLAIAAVASVDGRKQRVQVSVHCEGAQVAEAEFGCFVPERHVLDAGA